VHHGAGTILLSAQEWASEKSAAKQIWAARPSVVYFSEHRQAPDGNRCPGTALGGGTQAYCRCEGNRAKEATAAPAPAFARRTGQAQSGEPALNNYKPSQENLQRSSTTLRRGPVPRARKQSRRCEEIDAARTKCPDRSRVRSATEPRRFARTVIDYAVSGGIRRICKSVLPAWNVGLLRTSIHQRRKYQGKRMHLDLRGHIERLPRRLSRSAYPSHSCSGEERRR